MLALTYNPDLNIPTSTRCLELNGPDFRDYARVHYYFGSNRCLYLEFEEFTALEKKCGPSQKQPHDIEQETAYRIANLVASIDLDDPEDAEEKLSEISWRLQIMNDGVKDAVSDPINPIPVRPFVRKSRR